jgi:hypothetical protein
MRGGRKTYMVKMKNYQPSKLTIKENTNMGITDALKDYVPEKSTVGEKPTLKGVYKVSLFDVAYMEDKGYGESIYAQFKIQDVIAGDKSYSSFPEFKAYFNCAHDKIQNKNNGLKKLLDGLFSVGIDVDKSSDAALMDALTALKGTTMFINAWKGKKQKKNDDGTWEEDPEGGSVQKFSFMTEKNAVAKAKKSEVPF